MATEYGVQITSGELIPAAQTLIYTVPSDLARVVISSGRVANVTTARQNVDIWIVPSGESIADRHKAVVTREVAKNQTIILNEIIAEPLNEGDKIYAEASLADSLTITLGATTIEAP